MQKGLIVALSLLMVASCAPVFADGHGTIGGAVGYSAKLGDLVGGPLLGVLGYPKAEPVVSLCGGYLASDSAEVWAGGLMLHLSPLAKKCGLAFGDSAPLSALGAYAGCTTEKEFDYGCLLSLVEIPF